jgi:outer membrane assembly lipoprotein YfiO
MTTRAQTTRLFRRALLAAGLLLALGGPARAQWAWDADTGWINLRERPADSERGLYAHGVGLMVQGFHAGAADAFAEFERRYPASPLAAKSALNRARCLLRLGRQAEAAEAAHPLAGDKTQDAALRADAAAALLTALPQLPKESAGKVVALLAELNDESFAPGVRAAARLEESRRRLQLRDYENARLAALAAAEVAPPALRPEALMAAAMADVIACREHDHNEATLRRAAELLRQCDSASPETAALAREYFDVIEGLLVETVQARQRVYYAASLLYEREYDDAAAIFKAAAKKYKGTGVGEMAAYYRGETAFGQRDWNKAFELYEKCALDYPASRRMRALVEREFAVGKALDQEGDTSEAIRVMETVAKNYPLGALADDAYMFAGQAHLARADYVEAKSCFDVVVYGHPHSEWNTAALFLGGKCDLKLSDLARDNDVLLTQARRAFELCLRADPRGRFAEEARALLAECKEKQAAALMSVAAMYQRRTEPRAAMAYYEYVLKNYADSTSAAPARAAMAVLAEKGVQLPWDRPASVEK